MDLVLYSCLNKYLDIQRATIIIYIYIQDAAQHNVPANPQKKNTSSSNHPIANNDSFAVFSIPSGPHTSTIESP
jgi:hypothetical protein